MTITGTTLSKAMGGTLSATRYAALAPAVDDALRQAGCTTVNRAAMFLAQIGHESAGLRYMEERASGAAYEGRQNLGNTRPGDGKRFKGRGPIQITGRGNYTAVSKWAHDEGYVPTATYFVDNPGQLATDRYAFLGAVWYWTVARPMNTYADSGSIKGATKAVNGGYNGLSDRTIRWNRCRALGEAIVPSKAAAPAPAAKHAQIAEDGRVGPTTFKAARALVGASADKYLISYMQQQLKAGGYGGLDGKPLGKPDGSGLYPNLIRNTPATNTCAALQRAQGEAHPDGIWSHPVSESGRRWQQAINNGKLY